MELKTWNPKMIAKGFGYDSVQEWANDIKASDLSIPAERAIARLLDGEVTESQEEWDVIDQDGKRIEVRGLLGSQVFFNPSSDNGKNRPFNLKNFKRKLKRIDRYVLVHYRPMVLDGKHPRLYEITAKEIKKLRVQGKMNNENSAPTNFSVKRRKGDGLSQFDDTFTYDKYKLQLKKELLNETI